jgi:hypothetical protein
MERVENVQKAYEARMAKRNGASKKMSPHTAFKLGGEKYLKVGTYENKKETGFKDKRWSFAEK